MSTGDKFQFLRSAEMLPATITNEITTMLIPVKTLLKVADSFTPKHSIARSKNICSGIVKVLVH